MSELGPGNLPTPSTTKRALVFRKRLLPYSETFIADQGRFLHSYQAAFAGLYYIQSGQSLLQDSQRFILDEDNKMSMLSRLTLRTGLPLSNAWYRAIETFAPDLIHAHFLNDGLDARHLGRQLQVPVITTLHGHDITKPEKRTLLRRGHAGFFATSDKIIAVSNFIADQARAVPSQNWFSTTLA